MNLLKLFSNIINDFGNDHIHQIVIKFSEQELTELESIELSKWVNKYEDRKNLFEQLKQLIAFRKEISTITGPGIKVVLSELKSRFPEHFGQVDANLSFFTLKLAISSYVDQLILHISRRIVYGNKWIRIFAYSVRLVIIILLIMILIELL